MWAWTSMTMGLGATPLRRGDLVFARAAFFAVKRADRFADVFFRFFDDFATMRPLHESRAHSARSTSSCPGEPPRRRGLSRASRFTWHGRAELIGIAGTTLAAVAARPAMTGRPASPVP